MSDSPTGRNRLAGESSPYLLLHAANPVDWYPWGEEALSLARREDRPIFLSVGYSTCYWCHVMERESFSNPAIAELMNRHFVNVKLDREERPDLDEIYMTATQILTGQGGWPNSVFLTPGLAPFWAGTYFPPEDRHGRPGFATVLRSLSDAWAERREDVEAQAADLARALEHSLGERPPATEPGAGGKAAREALAALGRRFDPAWGGFGAAPKFPSPSNLLLLEELAAEDGEAERMLETTLDRMARGGIADQLAGGFHRYATDREWKVPHFEKMLYDNGLLLEIYARRAGAGDAQSGRVTEAVVDYLDREMTSKEGRLWSALDAETGGVEGAYYVWTRDELRAVLGEEDFGFLAPVFGFDGAPFFEGSHYVLHLPFSLEEQAVRRRTTVEALIADIEPLRRRLLDVRSRRQRPLTDDKVLADWNGMAIGGLAEAGRALGRTDWLARAVAAAEAVWDSHRPDGELIHSWRDGRRGPPAFLSDFAFLVRGHLRLAIATGDATWNERALDLAAEQERRLADAGGGWFGARAGDDLLVRSREVQDGAVPGANAIAALNALELAEVSGESRWRVRAEEAIAAFGALLERHPGAAVTLAVAAMRTGQRAAGADDGPVRVGLTALGATAAGGGRGRWAVDLTIDEGWTVYAAGPEGGEAALAVTARNALIEDLRTPAGEPLADGGHEVYRGAVRLELEVRVTGPEPSLELVFQPCEEGRCLLPRTVRLDLADGYTADDGDGV